jgi:hypothetical protein
MGVAGNGCEVREEAWYVAQLSLQLAGLGSILRVGFTLEGQLLELRQCKGQVGREKILHDKLHWERKSHAGPAPDLHEHPWWPPTSTGFPEFNWI